MGVEINYQTRVIKASLNFQQKGDSAYKIAVDEGFVGTKEEWLASLKQPAIDAGEYATEQGDYAKQVGIDTALVKEATEQVRQDTLTAKELTEQATLDANAAANNANSKATIAQTAATNANNAALNANDAADNANQAALISVLKTDIVNDLTTGGADKVLSAEQGISLKNEIAASKELIKYNIASSSAEKIATSAIKDIVVLGTEIDLKVTALSNTSGVPKRIIISSASDTDYAVINFGANTKTARYKRLDGVEIWAEIDWSLVPTDTILINNSYAASKLVLSEGCYKPLLYVANDVPNPAANGDAANRNYLELSNSSLLKTIEVPFSVNQIRAAKAVKGILLFGANRLKVYSLIFIASNHPTYFYRLGFGEAISGAVAFAQFPTVPTPGGLNLLTGNITLDGDVITFKILIDYSTLTNLTLYEFGTTAANSVFKIANTVIQELPTKEKYLLDLANAASQPLYGLTLGVLGDSIMEGMRTGGYPDQAALDLQNWTSLKNKLGLTDLINCGVGGAFVKEGTTISSSPQSGDDATSSLTNCYRWLKRLVDGGRPIPKLIMLWVGTNDAASGGVADNFQEVIDAEWSFLNDDTTGRALRKTFYGGLRWTLESINRDYPNSSIIIFTPAQADWIAYPTRTPERMLIVCEGLKKMAQFYSVPVVDAYNDLQVSGFLERIATRRWTGDGLHPNTPGKTLWTNFAFQNIQTVFASRN